MPTPNPYQSPLATPQVAIATHVRYVVLLAFALAAAIAYVQRNGMGVAVTPIEEELRVSDKQMGFILGSFFLSYALFQIPGGWLATRYGTRGTLTLYAVLWSLAAGAIGLAAGFWSLLAAQLAMGAAQAALFPCATGALARWLPSSRRGLASGLLASCMSAGSASGMALASVLLVRLGWRGVFFAYAVPGILWSLWFYWYFRDRPDEHAAVNDAELCLLRETAAASQPGNEPQHREPTPWLTILSSWAMWCICAQHVFRAAGYVFYGSWFPKFLQTTRGVSVGDSGLLASWPVAAVIVGGLSGGIISDRLLAMTGSRRIARQGMASICMPGGRCADGRGRDCRRLLLRCLWRTLCLRHHHGHGGQARHRGLQHDEFHRQPGGVSFSLRHPIHRGLERRLAGSHRYVCRHLYRGRHLLGDVQPKRDDRPGASSRHDKRPLDAFGNRRS
jgi:sugar phosphate permease